MIKLIFGMILVYAFLLIFILIFLWVEITIKEDDFKSKKFQLRMILHSIINKLFRNYIFIDKSKSVRLHGLRFVSLIFIFVFINLEILYLFGVPNTDISIDNYLVFIQFLVFNLVLLFLIIVLLRERFEKQLKINAVSFFNVIHSNLTIINLTIFSSDRKFEYSFSFENKKRSLDASYFFSLDNPILISYNSDLRLILNGNERVYNFPKNSICKVLISPKLIIELR